MASGLADAWFGKLDALCDDVRRAARGALCSAVERDSIAELARQSHQGAGDVTYAIDVPAERALDDWLASEARRGPLSLLTEDAGWRHVGPGPRGVMVELSGFDHGGPRIVVDPIDGTRNLMTDLRSAWTVVALAPPGASEPRMSDVVLGVLSELAIEGTRRPGLTGVWIAERKVCSIGVAVRRWVTWHGLALNLHTDLAPFRRFHPCGLSPDVMTRVADHAELPPTNLLGEVLLVKHFCRVFGHELPPMPPLAASEEGGFGPGFRPLPVL